MKLVLEFTKTGNMIYLSHLDLMRLFLRVLRMSGLRPAYSQGFNPHPKMSLPLPLPVGIYSVCELLEFEIGGAKDRKDLTEAVNMINERLPEGVRVKGWCEKPANITKPLASFISGATYEYMCEGIMDAPEKLSDFFARNSIFIKKRDKKTGSESEKDIRPQIIDYKIVKNMKGRLLADLTLAAAPGNTLSPKAFFVAFCEISGYNTENLAPVITRIDISGGDIKQIYDTIKRNTDK